MTKERKGKKYNSSVEEYSFEKTEGVNDSKEENGEGMDRKEDSLETIGKRIREVIEDMDEARNRCNGRINGQLKNLIKTIRENTEEIVRRAIEKDSEAEVLKEQIESLKETTEGLRKDFNDFVKSAKERPESEEIRMELAEIRTLKEELMGLREMQTGKGTRRNEIGIFSTPIGSAGRSMAAEEDRIEEISEEKMEVYIERAIGRTVPYPEAAGRSEKKIFGKRAGVEIKTKAVVKNRMEGNAGRNPIPETPCPQRVAVGRVVGAGGGKGKTKGIGGQQK